MMFKWASSYKAEYILWPRVKSFIVTVLDVFQSLSSYRISLYMRMLLKNPLFRGNKQQKKKMNALTT